MYKQHKMWSLFCTINGLTSVVIVKHWLTLHLDCEFYSSCLLFVVMVSEWVYNFYLLCVIYWYILMFWQASIKRNRLWQHYYIPRIWLTKATSQNFCHLFLSPAKIKNVRLQTLSNVWYKKPVFARTKVLRLEYTMNPVDGLPSD